MSHKTITNLLHNPNHIHTPCICILHVTLMCCTPIVSLNQSQNPFGTTDLFIRLSPLVSLSLDCNTSLTFFFLAKQWPYANILPARGIENLNVIRIHNAYNIPNIIGQHKHNAHTSLVLLNQ